MAVRTRVQSIERQVRVFMDRAMSPEAMSKRLAAAARSALADAQQHNAAILGRVPEHETIVDGRRGAMEESVRPDGVIVHEFATALRGEVLAYILDLLRRNAPVLTGRFKESITVYADGAEVTGPLDAVDAAEILFVPTVAYARKIEKGRGHGPKGGHGLFEGAAAMATSRFGNQAAVKFTFAEPPSGGTHLDQWAATKSGSRFYRGGKNRRRNLSRQADKDRRNPAVSVRFR